MITLYRDPILDNLDKVFEFAPFNNVVPKTTVRKNENDYKLYMSVPGLTKEDLKIHVKEGVLTISYEKKEKTDNFTFVSNFKKSYNLDGEIKENEIEGIVNNGILELTLPVNKKKSTERLISLN